MIVELFLDISNKNEFCIEVQGGAPQAQRQRQKQNISGEQSLSCKRTKQGTHYKSESLEGTHISLSRQSIALNAHDSYPVVIPVWFCNERLKPFSGAEDLGRNGTVGTAGFVAFKMHARI